MSQKEVFQIIKDLGGSAKLSEIKKVAESKYPDAVLYTYVLDRLKKLQKKGIVSFDLKNDVWKIVPQ